MEYPYEILLKLSSCDLESRALRALSHTGLYGHMGEGVNVTVAAVTGRN